MRTGSRFSSLAITLACVGLFLLSTWAGTAAAGTADPNGASAPRIPPSDVHEASHESSAQGAAVPTDRSWSGTHVAPLTGPNYTVTFTEVGLPGGTNWSVTFDGNSNNSTGTVVGFMVPNGTDPFSIGAVAGFVPAPQAGNLTVNGQSISEGVNFSAFTFNATFRESGLPGGTNWEVSVAGTLSSSSSTRITVPEANGTYPYTVVAISGYTTAPANGSLVVANDSPTIRISFSPVLYSVSFLETGLNATNWSVNLSGTLQVTNGTNLSFAEPNGTYAFSLGPVPGFVAVPPSGNVTVDGSDSRVLVAFSPFQFLVTFSESGLANGTGWSVVLAGDTQTSASTSLAFIVPNGSYSFQVPTVPGYTVAPSSGNVTVSGANAHGALTFTPLPPGSYAVSFNESGLPSGQVWSVDLGGTTLHATTSRIVFDVQNNTYVYSIGPVPGYRATPIAGSLTVAGAGQNVSVTFSVVVAPRFPITFLETGLLRGRAGRSS